MMLHTTPRNQCPYHVSTCHTLWFLTYSPDKILKLNVTTSRSMVKSMSHYDIAYLHSLTNLPTIYQPATPYGFRHIAILKVNVTTSRSKVQSGSYDVAHLNPLTMSLPSINL